MNRLQNNEEMGFFDYLFFGALLSKFKNKLKNHNDSTYSKDSNTYHNRDNYDTNLNDPLLDDDLGQKMFVEYDEPFYDEEDLYEEDLYDDDLYEEDRYDDDYYDEDDDNQ